MSSARTLPLFPLPLVLFPGTPLPLHIFEPRYRQLLADCQAGDGRFGIVQSGHRPERAIPRGHVGCVAELRDVQILPDGRANVLVEGAERFAVDAVVDSPAPYLVARVDDYGDSSADDPSVLRDAAARVSATFTRVARAARTIAGERDALPELPSDPALVAFRIASLVDFDLAERQALLVSQSPLGRLRRIESLLLTAVGDIERRAETHDRARSNGHGPRSHGSTGDAS